VKKILIFLLFLLPQASCSTTKYVRLKTPKGTQLLKHKLETINYQKDVLIKIKKTQVENDLEGSRMVHNKQQFIKKLYQQSTDPYYGTKRFDESCLRENEIFNISSQQDSVLFSADLTASDDYEIANCRTPNEIYKVKLIYGFCKSSSFVNEIMIYKKRENSLDLHDFKMVCEN
jgi:hypothetical protein